MSDQPDVTVIGAGYVDLVTAVGLASVGRRVCMVETRSDRLEALRNGRAPIHEPGLQDELSGALASGRLSVSDVPSHPVGVALICVGTPMGDDGRSDLSQLRSSLEELAPRLTPQSVVVIRSTLPIGGTRRVIDWSSAPTSRIFTNPEFLRQGSAVADFTRPSRIVVGCFPNADPEALRKIMGLYEGIDAPRFVVDVSAAEIIKNGANAFLALKLSFVNEISALSEEVGADVEEVLRGVAADPRIGAAYMRPSFGFGGSCLPKELKTLAVAGQDAGLAMHVTAAASAANHAQQERFARRIQQRLGGLDGKSIGLLGLAYKADTDDVRESPALRLAESLLASGARVRAYDPAAALNSIREVPDISLTDSAEDVFVDADAVVVGTEWPEFRDLPFARLRTFMKRALVFDGRRLLDSGALRALGYDVVVLGDGRGEAPAG